MKEPNDNDGDDVVFTQPDIKSDNNSDRPDQIDDEAVSVFAIDVSVLHTNDPLANTNVQGKYTAKIHTRENQYPVVLYVVREEKVGDFWKPVEKVDWLDIPGVVRNKISEIIECESSTDLAPDSRVIENGGEEI